MWNAVFTRLIAPTFVLAISAAGSLHAHTADTSYCKIQIGPRKVACTFTFDIATLLRMAPIDSNADHRITYDELGAAMPAIEAFLRRSVFLELNERAVEFGLLDAPSWSADAGAAIPASDYGKRLVGLTFGNPVLHPPEVVAIVFDFFDQLGLRHTVLGNFVASGQENPVVFTRAEPDYLFDTGYRVPAWQQFRQYLWLGVSHIFLGFDHIAFLLALFFVNRFVELVKIITAFTVAHSLTLALATLGMVSLPGRLVESAIAASIVYVAAENLWRNHNTSHRWRLTFAFGLVHGFGFAGVLRELGLPSDGLLRSLLAFNLGVELGQLAIAAACWPLLAWVGQRTWHVPARRAISSVLLLFGTAWLLDRLLALEWMPI